MVSRRYEHLRAPGRVFTRRHVDHGLAGALARAPVEHAHLKPAVADRDVVHHDHGAVRLHRDAGRRRSAQVTELERRALWLRIALDTSGRAGHRRSAERRDQAERAGRGQYQSGSSAISHGFLPFGRIVGSQDGLLRKDANLTEAKERTLDLAMTGPERIPKTQEMPRPASATGAADSPGTRTVSTARHNSDCAGCCRARARAVRIALRAE